ncbi:high affinity methionine permease, partial [Metarhizium majus ARSEF 297]
MDTNQCGIDLFTILRVVLMLLVVVTGWVVLGGGVSTVEDPHASFRNAFATSATSGNPYATALFKVLVSYSGWANSMAAWPRHLRRSVYPGQRGILCCRYTARDCPERHTVAPYFMGKVFGTAAKRALGVLVALSAFGNVFTVTFSQARVNQELAKEGVIPFPRFWASGWPFGSPSTGLILHFIPSFILIVAIPLGNAYNFIVDLEGYPTAVVNFLVATGLFCLRCSNPRASRPFKVWWPVAALFMVGQAFQLVVLFLRPPRGQGDTPPLPYWLYCVVGIGILVASVVYWFIRWVAAPKFGGYTLESHNEPLQDGTNVVVYRRVPRKTLGRNNPPQGVFVSFCTHTTCASE